MAQMVIKDAHALITLIGRQVLGEDTLQVTDTSGFVDVGNKILAQETDNITGGLNVLVDRIYDTARRYEGKLALIDETDTGGYSRKFIKISHYSEDARESGYFNTDLFTNFAQGFTAGENIDNGTARSTKSQWEQNPSKTFSLNFSTTSTWQDVITYYEDKYEMIFNNEENLMKWWNGVVVEKMNDMEIERESFRRATLLNYMAGIVDIDATLNTNRAINFTKLYNDTFGTSYTSKQLRTTQRKDFLPFFVAVVQRYVRKFALKSTNYHYDPVLTEGGKTYHLTRHTDFSEQKLFLFEPFWAVSKTLVMPEIFNDKYLQMSQFEPVDFWQVNSDDDDECAKINITPSIINDNLAMVKGDPVELDYVLGMLFDRDACMTQFQLEKSRSTEIEARKGFRNVWYTFAKGAINDHTENAVLFYMSDTNRKVSTKAKASTSTKADADTKATKGE